MFMGKKPSILFVITTLSIIGFSSAVHASSPIATTLGNGTSLFLPGWTLIDFESITPGNVTVSPTSTELLAAGISFPGSTQDEVIFNFEQTNNSLINVSDGVIVIEFNTAQQQIGVDFSINLSVSPGGLTFEAYSDNGVTLIGTTTSSGSTGFFGINGEGILIKQIKIYDSANEFQLDNLTFGAPVPLPGAVLMGMIGLGTIGVFRRKLL